MIAIELKLKTFYDQRRLSRTRRFMLPSERVGLVIVEVGAIYYF